jgi:hypothetical protein
MNTFLIGIWHRVVRLTGPLGLVALVLAFGAILLAAWLPKLDEQGEAIRAALEAKVVTRPAVAPVVAVRRVPVGQQIGEYVAAFPPFSQNSEDIKEVFLSAKRRNIQLPRGEYQLKNDAKVPLMTVTATFPVSADYASIKDFTADVLKALPNVSMDELRMTRNAALTTTLESSIRFSFVYRRP